MRVIKAQYAGACYGVKRALDIAKDTLDNLGNIYTLGPLIHNPNVVSELEGRGAHVVEDVSQIQNGTIVVRSHGITPDEWEAIAASGLNAVDATCPHVSRAQKAAARLGMQGAYVIVVGEAGHPEVMGLCAYARQTGAKVSVAQSASDIPDDIYEPVGVVVQTTQTKAALDEVVLALRKKGIEPIVQNTICAATTQRQKTAAELAEKVDAMVVIGGKNSSNTTRLYEICKRLNENTFHIESTEELKPEMFVGCKTVGVSAGASTPEDQITSVVNFLEGI